MKNTVFYFLLIIVSFSIFLFRFNYSKHAIFGDGNGYYAYAHALYFEKSLNFRPIYSYLSHFKGREYEFSRVFWDTTITNTGLLNNQWVIGPALLWIPSLLAISAGSVLLKHPISPYSPIMELGPAITGIILMVLSVYFIERTLLRFYSRFLARTVVSVIFLGTHFLYYLIGEPALSHQQALFLVSLLFWYAFQKKVGKKGVLFMGFLSGLLCITRPVDLILGISCFAILFSHKKLSLKKAGLIISGFIVGILPQLVVQQSLYGGFWINPYLLRQHGTFLFSLSHMAATFFSGERGLFTWHPVLLISILCIFVKKNKITMYVSKIPISLFIIFCIIISLWSGSLSAGFGNRFYLSALPFFAIGMANFFTIIPRRFVIYISIIFIIWNMLLLGQFVLYKKRMVDGVGNSIAQILRGQMEVVSLLKYKAQN